MKIAIQGIQGSFHDIAATTYFGNEIILNQCMSYTEISEMISSNLVDSGVMAIENSIAGAILPNYTLIDSNNLSINGEIYLPMIHNVLALPGQNISDINEIWSHPMALQHCEGFFRKHPHIRIVEEKDTALVAKTIEEKKLKGIAAIASEKAAQLYKLEILEKAIQNDELNMTRYFILGKMRNYHDKDYLNNKASLKFVCNQETGTLAEILTLFSKNNFSLTKIQSMPISKEPWTYAFFVDITFDDYQKYCQVLLALEKKVKQLKIIGEYQQNLPVI